MNFYMPNKIKWKYAGTENKNLANKINTSGRLQLFTDQITQSIERKGAYD